MAERPRAAWARQTDQELLRAHFLEELSADARSVVAEKIGDVAAYVRRAADEQGDVIVKSGPQDRTVRPNVAPRSHAAAG
ncbi:MAG: hypothetical protein KF773_08940 [Deltaproteobacteria bacterium]|nr:hypothetical protein [Deltaproteobacteria bacterium]